MIIKMYWIIRVLGYIVSLTGIFIFLAHQVDADPSTKNIGLALVGIGFLAFFVSYAIRAWLRFGPRRTPHEE